MYYAIEILPDEQKRIYASDDITFYDDMRCLSVSQEPHLDLTQVAEWTVEAERISRTTYTEMQKSYSVLQHELKLAFAYHLTPVTFTEEHSRFYSIFTFRDGSRRKFIIDEEVGAKINQINEDLNFFELYKPKFHIPFTQEVELNDKLGTIGLYKFIWCTMILIPCAFIVFLLLVIVGLTIETFF